jgi:hypothetical protein
MAGGGLTTLPVPDYMFDEHTFAGGGIVAFAKGDRVYGGGRVPGAPEVSDKQKAEYRAYALKKAAAMGLDPNQVDRIFTLESHYDPYAKSGKGNAPTGIAQLTTQMGKSLGLIDKDNKQDKRTDPYASIDASLRHLQTLNKKYNGDPTLVAVAYNQGETVLNKNLKANNGALDLNNFIGYNGKPTVEPFNYVKRVVTPQTQMARNEPPAPTVGQIAQSVLPGIPSAQAKPPIHYMTQPQAPQAQMPQFDVASAEAAPVQVAQDARFDRPPIQYMAQPQMPRAQMPQFDVAAAEAPTRADAALAALSALNPIGTAQAAETKNPQAAPKPHGPWPDAMKNPDYNPMVAPTIMPGTIDPGRKLSNLEVAKRGLGSTVGAGIVDYWHGLGNLAMTPVKGIAAGVNAVDRFANMPRGYNDVAPEAPRTPSKLNSTNYSRENDPMLKHMLADKPPAAPAPAAPAPVMAAGPAKETAEEAMARVLAANKKENFWNTMAQAGFGMMAGTSPNALTNIGAGLSAALPGMAAANKSDRELALKQQEMAQQRDISEKQLAAQTPATMQYANSQVALFKSKNPRATADQIEEVRSKAMIGYPVAIQKPTGQLTANQANVLAQNAAMTGQLPKGPDGKKVTPEQYAQMLLMQYGGGGLGGANLIQAADYFQ